MLALLAAMTVATTPAADQRPQTPVADPMRPVCKSNGRYEIADRALLYRSEGKALVTPLGRLPKANHEKAVLRTVDGCAAPLVVRHQVGR